MNVSLLNLPKIEAGWPQFYSEQLLYKSALDLAIKSLFNRRKAINVSHDNETLYDYFTGYRGELKQLHKDLASKKFNFSPVKHKHVKFYNKDRDLYIETWRDRIVDLILYRRLNQLFKAHISGSVHAYVEGFGLDRCQHLVRKYIAQNRPLFIIKRDIAKYFPSIDHSILLEQLSVSIKDNYLYELLSQRINAECITDDNAWILQKGVLFGTPLACFLANFHLHSMDLNIDRIDDKFYARYADDILIMTPSYDRAAELNNTLQLELDSRCLQFKPSHNLNIVFGPETGVFTPAKQFRFLGVLFNDKNEVLLSREKFRKIINLFRWRFKSIKRKLKSIHDLDNKLQLLVQTANEVINDGGIRPVAIIDYYLKHITKIDQFRLIDRWIAEEIISLATGRGHKKGNFKMVSFDKLRTIGLISLQHRKNLIDHGHIESSFFTDRNRMLIDKTKQFIKLK